MKDGKTNIMYVIGTILLLLSLSLVLNENVSAESVEGVWQSGSSLLSSLVMPGEHYVSGTLYDAYCYYHNLYSGLRF